MAKKKAAEIPLAGYILAPQEIPTTSLTNPNVFTSIQAVTTYNYGEDVAKWFAIEPFTKNHTSVNNILAIFDGNADTYYELQNSAAAEVTTTVTLDFGKTLFIRGFIFSFFFCSGSAGTKTMTTSYSTDGLNYTQINQTVAGTADEYHDDVAAGLNIRKVRFSFKSNNLGSFCRIYQLSCII